MIDPKDRERLEEAATEAGELHMENVWGVEYETLVSIFVAGAMWMAETIDAAEDHE